MRLAVPGAFLDCSAVTYVGVLPTHRRRGVLTSMMDRLRAAPAAAGRPVAVLWASQGAIYGRYGYGLATRAITLEVDSSRPLELRTVPDERPLRLVDPDSAAEVLGPRPPRAPAPRPGGRRAAAAGGRAPAPPPRGGPPRDEGRGVERWVDPFTQPGLTELHASLPIRARPAIADQLNCDRNLMSFSKNKRKSLTLYNSIAKRSPPKPNANPE
jgi:hypothetical protein